MLNFNLFDAEEIGNAIIRLKELTGKSPSNCADLIFSQDTAAKTLLLSNTNGIAQGVITSSQ